MTNSTLTGTTPTSVDRTHVLSPIARLVGEVIGTERSTAALSVLAISPEFDGPGDITSPAQLAMALNAALFADLLERVPTAARYVAEVRASRGTIVFDHGALRTIDGQTGHLPRGVSAFARLLEPLGYTVNGIYPLPRLNMTGRAFVHRDRPETIPQFFVSELHVDQLDREAQAIADRVFGGSEDPISAAGAALLAKLSEHGALPFDEAAELLRILIPAFDRQHPLPALADYEALLPHSREAAWIATEGNAFNHATTRVPDVGALAATLKARGYLMKDSVEVSANGRVRQTAFLADKVSRTFAATTREVPGSFYEFITRDIDPATGTLDLTFDSGNATGIFAVTGATAWVA